MNWLIQVLAVLLGLTTATSVILAIVLIHVVKGNIVFNQKDRAQLPSPDFTEQMIMDPEAAYQYLKEQEERDKQQAKADKESIDNMTNALVNSGRIRGSTRKVVDPLEELFNEGG